MSKKTKQWEQFERLVTAIHTALDPNAKVTWNDTINDRQFDVTIRFKKGLYDYLTVIECKDFASAVGVEKVEAFITKARDAGAHQAVMASSSGFQSGAREVANRHHVTLMHLSDSPTIELAFGAKWGQNVDAIHIERLELAYSNGEKRALPTSSSALTYYVSNIFVESGSHRKPLDSIVSEAVQSLEGAPYDTYGEHQIALPAGAKLITPDDGEYPSKAISNLVVRVAKTSAKTLTGPVVFDPSFWLLPDVKINNLNTGETKTVSRHGLALGTAERFEPGVFYEQPQNEYFYYCDANDGDLATLYLVESFQLGHLIQAEYTVKTKSASYYSLVSDPEVITRLKRRLARMKLK
jgi:hypothetical protein